MNKHVQRLEADLIVSISELKKNPSAVIAAGNGYPIAVLNHNKIIGYIVPPAAYEEIMERLDDLRVIESMEDQKDEPGIPVDIDDL